MKKSLFIIMMLLAAFSLASAEKMSVGAGYSQGFGTGVDQVGTLIGAYFQYDFNDWLSGRGGVGSLSSNMHKEFEQTAPGYTPYNQETDSTVSAMPYISIQVLANLGSEKGKFYFGPGYFTATASGESKYTETDTGDNYNIDITKQTISGISLTMGGKANITDSFFAYGEAFFVNSYQGEYEYDITYSGSTVTVTESGKVNMGLACLGFGVGMNF
jgi:hypothetical protein